MIESQKRYRQSPKGRAAAKRTSRKHQLKHKYGLSLEQYDAMLQAQNGGCAICGFPERDGKREHLSVDHDHACCPGAKSCGKCVRVLLCSRCNGCLGWYEKNKEAIASIVERCYL